MQIMEVFEMDISPLRAKYNELRTEVYEKASLLTKYDDTPADQLPEDKSMLYLQDCPVECPDGSIKTYSGKIILDPLNDDLSSLDIEEKCADGSEARYVFEKAAKKESVLKKTDTHKLKAEIIKTNSGPPEVILEEIRFVESSLAPEIETKSESLKNSILKFADQVKTLNDSENDKDKSKKIISISNVSLTSDEGAKVFVSGKIITDSVDGDYSAIDLKVMQENKVQSKFYYAKGTDYNYFKKQEEDTIESTQIFDKGGPKLVLFTEKHLFNL